MNTEAYCKRNVLKDPPAEAKVTEFPPLLFLILTAYAIEAANHQEEIKFQAELIVLHSKN
jgi:hypothetical protein